MRPTLAEPAVLRLNNAILLQGPVLAEVRWVLQRGAREIWRTDNVPQSAAITRLLRELAVAASRSGSEQLPPVANPPELYSEGQLDTEAAAQLLGISPRQVRNLSSRLGSRKVGGVLTFDLAAVQAELARREDVA